LHSFSLSLSLPQSWFPDGEGLEFAYNYAKVKLAGERLRRRAPPPSTVSETIAKLLPLSYPKGLIIVPCFKLLLLS